MTVVLIVEDDGVTRAVAEMVILDWGYQVLISSDVDEALALVRSSARIDVLFTDVYLKLLMYGGCDLAREAIMLRPELRVLYTTGNAICAELKGRFIDGAGCIRKPYTYEDLQDRLSALAAA